MLITQPFPGLVSIDPNNPGAPELVIDQGYSAITYDDQGRLIASRDNEILAVSLADCEEELLSDPNWPMANIPSLITDSIILYATYESGQTLGVIELNLDTGAQRLVTSSKGIVFPDIANFREPRGITLNSVGEIFVVDQGSPAGGSDGRIIRVDPWVPYDPANPQANQTVIASGSGASLPQPGVVYNYELQDPTGITFNPLTGQLLVTDQGRVLRFNQVGQLLDTITLPPELPLSSFNDIVIGPLGNYLVVGHSLYLTVNAAARITPGGAVTTLTTALFRPTSLAIVPPGEPDGDEDGTPDADDNCPTVPNEDQLDSDEDEIGDVCDNCRYVENPAQTDKDQDGIGNLCDGDFDQSGFCNVTDLLWFLDAFGKSTDDDTCPDEAGEPTGSCGRYDLTGEGTVINVSDLLEMIDSSLFGTSTSDQGCAEADDGVVHCPLP
jgi:hypothetical protein